MVCLPDGLQTGFADNRTLAVIAAIKAINKATKQRRAAIRAIATQLRSRIDNLNPGSVSPSCSEEQKRR
jgi:hypothetical protein